MADAPHRVDFLWHGGDVRKRCGEIVAEKTAVQCSKKSSLTNRRRFCVRGTQRPLFVDDDGDRSSGEGCDDVSAGDPGDATDNGVGRFDEFDESVAESTEVNGGVAAAGVATVLIPVVPAAGFGYPVGADGTQVDGMSRRRGAADSPSCGTQNAADATTTASAATKTLRSRQVRAVGADGSL